MGRRVRAEGRQRRKQEGEGCNPPSMGECSKRMAQGDNNNVRECKEPGEAEKMNRLEQVTDGKVIGPEE